MAKPLFNIIGTVEEELALTSVPIANYTLRLFGRIASVGN